MSFKQDKYCVIQDKFLTQTECKKLIKFYKKGLPKSFNTTYPLELNPLEHTSLVNKINKVGIDINNSVVDWFQIVKWPFPNKGKNLHTDDTSFKTTLSSIIYLNDDYRGGHTFFKDNTSFAPVEGRAIFFDGKYYPHGVSSIDEGDRYTVAIWLKKNK